MNAGFLRFSPSLLSGSAPAVGCSFVDCCFGMCDFSRPNGIFITDFVHSRPLFSA